MRFLCKKDEIFSDSFSDIWPDTGPAGTSPSGGGRAKRMLRWACRSLLRHTAHREEKTVSAPPPSQKNVVLLIETSNEYARGLLRLRIDRVKQLLGETDLPMTRVAQLTGFRHVEYMSAAFKRRVGLSPREYRRTAQA